MTPRPRPARIALLLADVDGTLVTQDKRVTPRAQGAVAKLAEQGIALAITSGRPPKGMLTVIKALHIATPVAGFNGGAFVQADMTPIEIRTIDPAVARQAAGALEKAGLDVWLYAGEDWIIRDGGAPHVAREQHTVAFPPRIVAQFPDNAFDDTIKIVGVSDDPARIAACEKTLHDLIGDRASAARSQPYYLDITNPQATKGGVVAYLSKTLGIDAGEIATIGDMPNDVLMFHPSGFAIAMGNASAEVQGQADAVTDSNEDEGFAKAVERFILS